MDIILSQKEMGLPKKILSIVGARPQFIKLAPLNKKMQSEIKHVIVHTGQHFDHNMSQIFFEEMKLNIPDYNLNISSESHANQIGLMLIEIEKILIKENPDIVIVFGDTNSTLSGGLAASKLGIKLIHIEAGLRSFNRSMPEEINRIIVDHCSDHLFAPTQDAMDNMHKEGLNDKACLTGDIMVDSMKLFLNQAINQSQISDRLNLDNFQYALLTLHRPYNVDNLEKLSLIFEFLNKLEYNFIFPVHPRTKKMILEFNIKCNDRIKLIDPVGYLDFLVLQSKAFKIFTDSGGIQKEAYILKTPCITIRSETEWVETISAGWNKLADPNIDNLNNLVEEVKAFNPKEDKYVPVFGENVAEYMLNKIYGILK